MTKSSSVSTVDRLVRVLDCFSPQRPAWSLSDLCAHLGLPKPTLHRFLVSLETHNILRRNLDDKLWRPGYRLLTWGELATQTTGLKHLARPWMEEIAAATGETVALTVYAEHEVICIEKLDTHHSVRLNLEVGARRPAHAGASSKILMAFLSDEEVQAIISERGLPKLCTNTITDPAELQQELARIRGSGYALSVEETDPGAWGIATPIRGRNGDVVAAIGVAGPILRFSDDLVAQYVAVCRQAAGEISHLLGVQDTTFSGGIDG